jgi:CDP-diacylglycerol--glycerol-3-phosphate 3-phosphatidyltransferase
MFAQSVAVPSLNQQALVVLGPIACFAAFWVVAWIAFKIDMKVRGQTAFDARLESHKTSIFISRDFLLFIIWLGNPVKKTIIRLGITPDMITGVSVVFAAAGAVSAARGWFAPAGMLFIVGGLCDTFDGWVARETNQSSAAGSFLDSLLDRVSEVFMFSGYIFYYAGQIEAVLGLTALGASQAFSYARAKGESLNLGSTAKGGMMGRPERVLSLSVASILAPVVAVFLEGHAVRPSYYLLSFVLGTVAVFSTLSLILRCRAIYRALKAQPSTGSEGR